MALPSKRKAFFLLLGGAVLYFLLSYHIIIIEGNLKNTRFLKKSSLSLHYAFFNTRGRSNKSMLSIDILRENGLGEILIEEGLISQEEEQQILQRLESRWE